MTDWRAVANDAVLKEQAVQDRRELAVLLALLECRRPRTVVEIGTWAAGLTWALARLPDLEQVVTVDTRLQPGAVERISALPVLGTYIKGDSASETTIGQVTDALYGEWADVLVIDGDHAYGPASADWEGYRHLVTPGGVAVIHDTQGYPGRPDVEVPRLWAEIRDVWETTELVSRPGGPFGTGIVWL